MRRSNAKSNSPKKIGVEIRDTFRFSAAMESSVLIKTRASFDRYGSSLCPMGEIVSRNCGELGEAISYSCKRRGRLDFNREGTDEYETK